MSLNGVRIETGKHGRICFIDDFTAELQTEIKKRLTEIFHGASEVSTEPDFYSYKNTLKSFLERYNSKDENTKKGMMGELLAHLLLEKYHTNHRSISILKNKEERSSKKGFDIVYYDSGKNKIWYSEVKSGDNATQASSEYNTVLLGRSKRDIHEKLSSERNSIWESAMIDATLTIDDAQQKIKLKELLSADSPALSKDVTLRKNAIMVSVLYHHLNDLIEIDSVDEFHSKTVQEEKFIDIIVFSIQKATYQKIAKFIEDEAK